VTVQESGFFRHPDQFAALAHEVLPALEGPVVVWSAGCANGQEAYSLAMELAASGHPDWQVLATDISAAAVARTRAARYTTAELAGIPPVHRRWLLPAGDLWEVDPTLRARVRVEQANLTTRFPTAPGRCQVVFCRTCSSTWHGRSPSRSSSAWRGGWPPVGWCSSATPRPSCPRPGACAPPWPGAHTCSGSRTGRGPGGCGQPRPPLAPLGDPRGSGAPTGSRRAGGRPGTRDRPPS